MYSLPSMSKMRSPFAFAMNGGLQSTLAYERTGLLTPPGMSVLASLKAARDFSRFSIPYSSSLSHLAASSAWYVMMMSAPARFMLVSVSSTMRFSSIQPFAAAALTIAYSPLTL